MDYDPRDFALAVQITVEREGSMGEPWCTPRDAKIVKSWVTERSKPLGGALRQLTRFARIMDAADGRSWINFLYVRVNTLRTSVFAQAFEEALICGALEGIAKPTERGVVLSEPGMASGDVSFALDYAQMPRLAALLDILNNALGFSAVEARLMELIRDPHPGHADEVARHLASDFNAWLTPRLASTHQLRQAQTIRAFIGKRGSIRPDCIDEKAILDLWIEFSAQEEIEGFRMFRSAARLALRYRQALALAATEASVLAAAGVGTAGSDRSRPAIDLDREHIETFETFEWISPFETLFSPPANQVKWLTKIDRTFLANIFGEGEVNSDEPLFGNSPFDLSHVPTLLRSLWFGPVQNALVERMRKNGGYKNFAGEAGYVVLAERFAELVNQVQMLACATTHVLLRERRIEGLALAQAFMEEEFRTLVEEGRRTLLDDASKRLRPREVFDMLSDGIKEDHPIARKAATAFKQINRQGFRKEDLGHLDIVEALIAGSGVLESLHAELARLSRSIGARDLSLAFMRDYELFTRQFVRLYGG